MIKCAEININRVKNFVSDSRNIIKSLIAFRYDIDRNEENYNIPDELNYNYIETLDKNEFEIKYKLSPLNILNYFTLKYYDMKIKKFKFNTLEHDYISLIERNEEYIKQLIYCIENIEKVKPDSNEMGMFNDIELTSQYLNKILKCHGIIIESQIPLSFKNVLVNKRFNFYISDHALYERTTIREIPMLYIYNVLETFILLLTKEPDLNRKFKTKNTYALHLYSLNITILFKLIKRSNFGGMELICTTFLKGNSNHKTYIRDLDNVFIYVKEFLIPLDTMNEKSRKIIEEQLVWIK